MYGYPRTLHVCFSVPESKSLPCPPNYEYSLIIGDAIPSNEGMVHHSIRGGVVPLRNSYEALHLDVTGPGKRIIALVNMKNVYTIVEEKGIEEAIANVSLPFAPHMWVENVIEELVHRRFLSPTDRGDTTEGVFREIKVTTEQFLATATQEHRELAEKGALGPQRTVPALVLRSSQASEEQGTGQVSLARRLSRRLSRSKKDRT